MRYRLAVFDMDGTVLDTLADLRDACNYALAQCGFPERSTDEIRRFVGNGVERLISLACPEDATEEDRARVLEIYRPYYRAHASDQAKPYPGIPELLHTLKDAGMYLAMVSNKPHPAVCDLCEVFFPQTFDVVIGESKERKRKPAPDMTEAAIAQVNESLARDDVVYIGDSEVDVETAKNAGVGLIAVSWGFRGADELRAAGAKTIVSDADELRRILL